MWRCASHAVNDVRALSGIALTSCEFPLLYAQVYAKISLISIFSFLVFSHDFIICIDYVGVAVSNTVTDDVKN